MTIIHRSTLATLADCIDVKLVDSTLDDHVVLLTVVPRHMDSYSFMSWIQSIISYIDKAFLNRWFVVELQWWQNGVHCSSSGRKGGAIKRMLFDLPGGTIPVPDTRQFVHVNTMYKHLGSQSSYRFTMDVEVDHRVNLADTAMGPLS